MSHIIFSTFLSYLLISSAQANLFQAISSTLVQSIGHRQHHHSKKSNQALQFNNVLGNKRNEKTNSNHQIQATFHSKVLTYNNAYGLAAKPSNPDVLGLKRVSLGVMDMSFIEIKTKSFQPLRYRTFQIYSNIISKYPKRLEICTKGQKCVYETYKTVKNRLIVPIKSEKIYRKSYKYYKSHNFKNDYQKPVTIQSAYSLSSSDPLVISKFDLWQIVPVPDRNKFPNLCFLKAKNIGCFLRHKSDMYTNFYDGNCVFVAGNLSWQTDYMWRIPGMSRFSDANTNYRPARPVIPEFPAQNPVLDCKHFCNERATSSILVATREVGVYTPNGICVAFEMVRGKCRYYFCMRSDGRIVCNWGDRSLLERLEGKF